MVTYVARHREASRTALAVALIIVAFFLAPFGEHLSEGTVWVRASLFGIALAFLAWLVSRHVAHVVRSPDTHRAGSLVIALVLGVVVFALADLVVATASPGEFADLRTKMDALYFSVTTLTTVGFGDVHAQGQLARGLVTAQLVFDVVVLATAARSLIGVGRGAADPGDGTRRDEDRRP